MYLEEERFFSGTMSYSFLIRLNLSLIGSSRASIASFFSDRFSMIRSPRNIPNEIWSFSTPSMYLPKYESRIRSRSPSNIINIISL